MDARSGVVWRAEQQPFPRLSQAHVPHALSNSDLSQAELCVRISCAAQIYKPKFTPLFNVTQFWKPQRASAKSRPGTAK